jgi:hypothetical protein
MSALGRMAARLAVRLYPGTWRGRYGAEVLDLIDSSDSSVRDAADLARSALDQHVSGGAPMRFEPARRHPGAFAAAAALLLAPTLIVVALSLIGHELGFTAVASVTDPLVAWIDTVRPIDLALVAAPLAAFLIAVLPLLDLRLEQDEGSAALAVRVRALPLNLVVASLALLVGAALIGHIVTESVLRLGA